MPMGGYDDEEGGREELSDDRWIFKYMQIRSLSPMDGWRWEIITIKAFVSLPSSHRRRSVAADKVSVGQYATFRFG